MQKKAGILLTLGVSFTAVAATQSTVQPGRQAQPAPVQTDRMQAQELLSGRPVPPAYVAPAAAYNGAIASSLARWRSLRGSDNLPFSSYASFLVGHRGWPGEAALRRTAERQSGLSAGSPAEVVSFFQALPPQTAAGHAGLALALQATGRGDEARTAARAAWTGGALPESVEQRLQGAFGSTFTPADHDARVDALLSEGALQSAERALAWAPAERRPVYQARLALQRRSGDAPALYGAVSSLVATDPGLLIDRANYLRETGGSVAARQLLAQPRRLTRRPANPEKFMEAAFVFARGAANDRQWSTAFDIARQVEDIYAPGTVIRARSFGERDEYTNLTWLAGTTALQRLARPADAARMFELYGQASASPQSQTKGLYWAGRAAQAAGQAARATTFFQTAATHYDQYYGQLSAERIAQPLPTPAPNSAAPASPAERAAFNARPLVAAVRYLGANGDYRDQSDFIRALAQHVETERDRNLAVQLSQEIGRQDLAVITAREARAKGSFEFKRSGFPEVQVPPAQGRLWSVVHGITRQESLFDRRAVSRVGARGLMQLMPGTAREVAGRLGVSHEQSRLDDPQYNVMLGSSYFQTLLNQWGGSYPLAVASYNAGAGNVRRWVNENGDPRTPGVDMVDWIERIPFSETRNYVQRVLENAVVYDLMNPARAGSPPQNRLSFYLGKSGRPG